MPPALSIIIPCYKSEATLPDTLQSVYDQDFDHWEALIINDGSPDAVEEIALSWAEKDSRFRYFKKINGGLGSARNRGLEEAQGLYVLPLDSDNKVDPHFATKAINILKEHSDIGIVHGHAQYFGEKDGLWNVPKFDKYKMLSDNYIDACAIIRKVVFDTVGKYDENMPFQGHEDWEFWIRTLYTDFGFYHLGEVCFEYRVTGNSMIRTFDDEMTEKNIEYILNKHWKLYHTHYRELLTHYNSLRKAMDQSRLLKLSKITRFFKRK